MSPDLRVHLTAVLCACSFFSEAALAAGFLPPQHYAVGKAPINIVLADFNRDGKIDIATCNLKSHDVSILLGNGDGTFQASKTYPAAPDTRTSTIDLVAGDFNEDGNLDLVVTLGDSFQNQENASLLLGKGDGSFRAPQVFYTGAFAEPVVSADFNGDKHLDLFFGGSEGSSVVLGNGDGTFQPPVIYSTGGPSRITGVALADFNGDGNLDVAVANEDDASIGILLSRGDGTFAPVTTLKVATFPYYIAAADYNHDGKIDLALSFASYPTGGAIDVYLNNGDATFTLGSTYQVGTSALYMAAADLNGDGNVDLAMGAFETGSRQSGAVAVLYGVGDGTFDGPLFYRAAPNVYAIVAGQFNTDPLPDIAVTVPGKDGVAVLINNGPD